MTVDQLVQRYAAARVTISRLRTDNQRVWESREEWKAKHAERWKEIQALRRDLKRMTEYRDRWRREAGRRVELVEVQNLRVALKRSRTSRDKWRKEARKRGEKLYNYRRNGAAPWHNVRLSERDLERILDMPVRR